MMTRTTTQKAVRWRRMRMKPERTRWQNTTRPRYDYCLKRGVLAWLRTRLRWLLAALAWRCFRWHRS